MDSPVTIRIQGQETAVVLTTGTEEVVAGFVLLAAGGSNDDVGRSVGGSVVLFNVSSPDGRNRVRTDLPDISIYFFNARWIFVVDCGGLSFVESGKGIACDEAVGILRIGCPATPHAIVFWNRGTLITW